MSEMVFFSYPHECKEQVAYYCRKLTDRGFTVWMDSISLKGGQEWEFEIKKHIAKCDIAICFIPSNYETGNRYFSREIEMLISRQNQLKERAKPGFIVPVLLDDTAKLPSALQHLHAISVAIEGGLETELAQLVQARMGENRYSEQTGNWSYDVKEEEWDGCPGYQFEVEILKCLSTNSSLKEIEIYINHVIMEEVFSQRQVKLDQDPSSFNFGLEKFQRTNTLYASCDEIHPLNRTIAFLYRFEYYSPGAAHGQSGILTFNFFLEPTFLINSLANLFLDQTRAFQVIQSLVRNELNIILHEASYQDDPDEYLTEGTREWGDFKRFLLTENLIKIFFPPYQVACYAAGEQSVEIPYSAVHEMMTSSYASALQSSIIDLT
ncbi:TIR domain-containing protein [Rivihabitans pingtungensis]|uniref:TIR domain-containing protein n=1 Tax=Rivihabitans pingtungensis TaxID=1054498 RepID=UPI002355E9C1|nr:TIR domain-containing protein [Rivihabitans pingtungensis]MCK6436733.1 TIR domain-containing protein [Rivihabitans pingtungensis]